ncbi:MAG TPA: hypothetical protein VK927_01035 [Adhaeribacter sp.]|nr:hypothetical protein [Adhaeribacter sp.]
MEYELAHLEEFDRYESGQMPVNEAESFRQRLLIDKDLAEEHMLYLTLRTGIRTYHRKRLKNLFQKFEANAGYNNLQVKGLSSGRSVAWKWAVAASATVVLATGLVVWQLKKTTPWERAYIEEPGLPVLMSQPVQETSLYNQSMNFYRQGQFKEALASLPVNNSDTVAYFKGIFSLKMENPDSAVWFLQRVRGNQGSAFTQKADYYAAMALWKAKRTSEAITIFNEIAADQNHKFHSEAAAILQNLNF